MVVVPRCVYRDVCVVAGRRQTNRRSTFHSTKSLASKSARCIPWRDWRALHEMGVAASTIGAGSTVDASATLGPGASIGAGASVKANATIGWGVVVGDGAVVGEGAVLRTGVIVESNAVISDRVTLDLGVWVGGNAVVGDGAKLVRLQPPNCTLYATHVERDRLSPVALCVAGDRRQGVSQGEHRRRLHSRPRRAGGRGCPGGCGCQHPSRQESEPVDRPRGGCSAVEPQQNVGDRRRGGGRWRWRRGIATPAQGNRRSCVRCCGRALHVMRTHALTCGVAPPLTATLNFGGFKH